MDISSGQSVMQEISQKHSQHATIKEVLKLVTLSELLQQNSCEMWSNFDWMIDTDIATCTETLVKFGHVVLKYARRDTLVTILCSTTWVNGCSASWNQLYKFCQMIIPMPKRSDSFADELAACTRRIECYINSELSPVIGTTYHNLRQFVESIDMSRYFECGFAARHQMVDIASQDDHEARSSDVNTCEDGHQLSDDESEAEVTMSLNDAVVKVETSQSHVHKSSSSSVLNGDGNESCTDTLMTFLNGQRRRGRPKSGRPTCCCHCGKKFASPSALSLHVRTHTGHRPYVCSHCSRSFTQLGSLTRHLHRKHATSKPYICAYCDKPFALASLLRSHLLSHDIMTAAPSRHIVQYACGVCGVRKSKRHQLICHIRIHTRDQLYLCSKCGRSFTSASYFYRHRRIHMSSRTVPCPLCDRKFAGVDELRQHHKVHSDYRPYVCLLCDRAFKRLVDLRTHSRTHSGHRPYICQLCSAAFTQYSSLRYHKLVHSNERRHPCAVCSQCFRTADKLRIHALVHSGERPHTCDKCGRNFGDRSSFRRHMRRIHTFKKEIS